MLAEVVTLNAIRVEPRKSPKCVFLNFPRVAILAAISIGSEPTCGADLLDFNSPPVEFQESYYDGRPYIEDGFRMSSLAPSLLYGGVIRRNPFGTLTYGGTTYTNFNYNDTIYCSATYFAFPYRPTLDRPDGSLFTISQIDLGAYSPLVVFPSVSFQGNKLDGTSVVTTFSLSEDFEGVFHTYQFGPEWTNLRSVYFPEGSAWDNVVVSVVPETELGVLSLGLIALLAQIWRKKAVLRTYGVEVGATVSTSSQVR